jgi:hypothetical protein
MPILRTLPKRMSLRDFGADESADEMLAVNPDYHNLVELLGAARNDMVMRLAEALTITRDASLRDRLAEIVAIDPGREFLIGQSKNQSWLKVGGCGYAVLRGRQAGLPAIDLDEGIRTRPEFERSLQISMQRTGAVQDAYNILEPVFEPSVVQSRANFHEIFEWAPLLEQLSYKAAMRVLHVLDTLRSVVRFELSGTAGIGATSLRAYWQLVHALGQLILLASSSDSRPWLADMANSFVWQNWTPSFVLLRERTFWLAAIAARSASAFGETVVERYLRRLSQAEHPMMVFDALFGLTAIALANPSSKAPILTELRKSARRQSSDRPRSDALSHLTAKLYPRPIRPGGQTAGVPRASLADGQLQGYGHSHRPRRRSRRASASGEYLGFSMLPFVTDSFHDEHFPKFPAVSEKEISRAKIAGVFRRAWVAEPARPARHLLN